MHLMVKVKVKRAISDCLEVNVVRPVRHHHLWYASTPPTAQKGHATHLYLTVLSIVWWYRHGRPNCKRYVSEYAPPIPSLSVRLFPRLPQTFRPCHEFCGRWSPRTAHPIPLGLGLPVFSLTVPPLPSPLCPLRLAHTPSLYPLSHTHTRWHK